MMEPIPAQQALELMVAKGYSLVQACGWIGNAQQEDYQDLQTHALGDHGEAHGLFQWHTNRWKALLDYAAAAQSDPYDLATQLSFSLIEPGEGRAHAMLKAAATIEEAVDAGIAYTRPGNPRRDLRLKNANALMAWWNDEHPQ